MRTLIVGCGYLGLRVAENLLRRGDQVFGTTRSVEKAEELRRAGLEPRILDLLDLSEARLPEVDRLFYGVAYDRRSGGSAEDVHGRGLTRLLEAMRGRVGRVVLSSSTGVYHQSGGDWVDEDSAAEPTTASGRACLMAEDLVRAFGEQSGVTGTALRFSGLYGPGRVIRRAAIAAGEPIRSDPETFLNLIHIDDAAEAATLALEQADAPELLIVSDDRPITRGEYYGRLAKLIEAPPPRFVPPEGDPAESHKRVRNQKARETLGWSPRFPDIEAGLPDALSRS